MASCVEDIVFINCQTTGPAYNQDDRIIQLAMIRVNSYGENVYTNNFSSPVSSSRHAFEMHNMSHTNIDIANFGAHIIDIKKFLTGTQYIVASQVHIFWGFLSQECARYNQPIESHNFVFVNLTTLCKKAYPKLGGYSLETLENHLGFVAGPENSLAYSKARNYLNVLKAAIVKLWSMKPETALSGQAPSLAALIQLYPNITWN